MSPVTLTYAAGGMRLPLGEDYGMNRFGDMFGFWHVSLGQVMFKRLLNVLEESSRKQVDLKFWRKVHVGDKFGSSSVFHQCLKL